MNTDTSPSGTSSAEPHAAQQQKRTRVLLSCGPCRVSKLKCDREQPCSQCLKKGRDDLCVYAPKPEKKRPAKGMASRLKRLEGMVREMMDGEGSTSQNTQGQRAVAGPAVKGHVVQGENATTYVGATHCLAMLEDIEDLKSYFDEPDEQGDDNSPSDEFNSADVVLAQQAGLKNRHELLQQLPERDVADRLIKRYFASMSPAQHVIHRTSFTRKYTKFWQNPEEAHIHWVAQLFMMLSLGVFYNYHMNATEVEGDSPLPPVDRIRHYKSCAGFALALGKFTQPSAATLPAFVLYTESDFLFNRAAQMNCYILSGVLMRLMLKMGLHRDPSKLANISPFEGEMRRRMWNMAIQVELLVSFHMGLPSMLQGIESDTDVPRNLVDDDFDEDSTELPPGRPTSDYTPMTYPIHKTRLLRVFGQIARQAHALTPPSYSEVMRLDDQLQEVWKSIPQFMKFRPLDECVGDPPSVLIQRFGMASLYNKSRCVLHRRYLAEAIPQREHDFSRKQCLEGATTLLNFQFLIWEACKPGRALSENGWFISSLAVHDYLLAAMILYMVIKNEHSFEAGDWAAQQQTATQTKEELKNMIKRSCFIWSEAARNRVEVKKTADTLALMLAKLGCSLDEMPPDADKAVSNPTTTSNLANESPSIGAPSMDPSSMGSIQADSALFSSLQVDSPAADFVSTAFSMDQATQAMGFPDMGPTAMNQTFDPSWMETTGALDWRYLDVSLAHSHDAGRNPDTGQTWMERATLDDMDMMGSAGEWTQLPHSGP